MAFLQSVSDPILVALAKHAPRLERLDVSFCRHVTDAGLGQLVSACPALTHIELWGCSQLSEHFFLGHARTQVAATTHQHMQGDHDSDACAPVELRIYGRPGDVMPVAEYL